MKKRFSRMIALFLSIAMLMTGMVPAALAEQEEPPVPVEVTENVQQEPTTPTQAPEPSDPPVSVEPTATLAQSEPPAPTDAPVETDPIEEPPAPSEEPTASPEPSEEPTETDLLEPTEEPLETELPEELMEEEPEPPVFTPHLAWATDELPLFDNAEREGEPFGTLAQGVLYVSEQVDEETLYVFYAELVPEGEPVLCDAWVEASLLTPLSADEVEAYAQSLQQSEAERCYVDGGQTIALLALAVEYPQVEDELALFAAASNATLSAIRISGKSSISKNKGTMQLTVTPVPSQAELGTITWSITEPSGLSGLVADISATGLVTAKGNGKVTVTATVNGTQISAKKTITISKQVVPTTGISLSAPANWLIVGKTLTITPVLAPLTATDKKLTWSIAEGATYASVSSSGKVSLKSKAFTDASARVVVRAALKSDPTIYAEYDLTAYPKPTAIQMDKTATTLYLYQEDLSQPVPTVERAASLVPGVLSECDEIVWKSSSTKIATVDSQTGKLTPLKAGKVTVTASSKAYSNVKASFTVTIQYPVESISVEGKKGQNILLEGKSLTMLATLSPKNATNKKLSWEIMSVVDVGGDPVVPFTSAVSLSKGGTLRALKNKQTATLQYPLDVTVRATALGADPNNNGEGIGYAERIIKVYRPVTTLYISTSRSIIDLGSEDNTLQLGVDYGATVDEVQQGVAWTSSNKKVATVDENGLVTATGKAGSTTISAKATDGSGKSAKLSVRVATAVQTITLAGPDVVAATKSITLTATIAPATASVKKLTWTTSDKTIATVSSSGKVTGKKEGVVTITATATDGSGMLARKQITIAPLPTSIAIQHGLTADPLLSSRLLLDIEQTATLTANILPANAAKAVTWKSSSTSVATVTATEDGCVITPQKLGATTITATTTNGKLARITIRVQDAKALGTPTSLIALGDDTNTVQLSWQHADAAHKPSRYAIYQQDSSQAWKLVATTTSTTYTMQSLPNGTYVFSVVPQVLISGSTYENGTRATFDSVTVYREVVYRALLIGQQNYGGGDDLDATDDDVKAMTQVLSQGSTAYQVTAKMDIGKSAVLNAIKTTFADATEDDVSLFFYSGHGAYAESDNLRGALYLVDRNIIKGSELASALSKVPGKVIVILESCYSGNFVWDGSSLGLSLADANANAREQAEAFNDAIIQTFSAYGDMELQSGELRKSKFYVLTAAAYNQSGMENYYDGLDIGFGFLTRGLCEGVGYQFAIPNGYQWSNSFPGDANSDNVISLTEARNYAQRISDGLYNEMYEMGYSSSAYPKQQVQIYPTGSTQPLFYKKK